MDLKTYFFSMSQVGREEFALHCGTTYGHLRNVAYGYREPSTELAVAIERESSRAVTRQELFPSSYGAKWPELTESKAGA